MVTFGAAHWLKSLKPVKRLVPPRELTPAMQAAYP